MAKTKSSKEKKEWKKNSGVKEKANYQPTYTVERVIDRRIEEGVVEYLTLWKGYKKLSWWPINNFILDGELLPCVTILDEILDGKRKKPEWRIKYEKKRDSGGNVMKRDKPVRNRKKIEVEEQSGSKGHKKKSEVQQEGDAAEVDSSTTTVRDETKKDTDTHGDANAPVPVPPPPSPAVSVGTEASRGQDRVNEATASDAHGQRTVVVAAVPAAPSVPPTLTAETGVASGATATAQVKVKRLLIIKNKPHSSSQASTSSSSASNRATVYVQHGVAQQRKFLVPAVKRTPTANSSSVGASTMSHRNQETVRIPVVHPVARSGAPVGKPRQLTIPTARATAVHTNVPRNVQLIPTRMPAPQSQTQSQTSATTNNSQPSSSQIRPHVTTGTTVVNKSTVRTLQHPNPSTTHAKIGAQVSPSQQLFVKIANDAERRRKEDQRMANGSTTKNLLHSGISPQSMGGASYSRTGGEQRVAVIRNPARPQSYRTPALDELSRQVHNLGYRGPSISPRQQIHSASRTESAAPNQRTLFVRTSSLQAPRPINSNESQPRSSTSPSYQLSPVNPDAIISGGTRNMVQQLPRNFQSSQYSQNPNSSGNSRISPEYTHPKTSQVNGKVVKSFPVRVPARKNAYPSTSNSNGNGRSYSRNAELVERYYDHKRQSQHQPAGAQNSSEAGYINARQELNLGKGRTAERRQVVAVSNANIVMGASVSKSDSFPADSTHNLNVLAGAAVKQRTVRGADKTPKKPPKALGKGLGVRGPYIYDDDLKAMIQKLHVPFSIDEIEGMNCTEFKFVVVNRHNYTAEQILELKKLRSKISQRKSRRIFREKEKERKEEERKEKERARLRTAKASELTHAKEPESVEQRVMSILQEASAPPPVDSSSLPNSSSSSSGADEERDVLNDPPCSSTQSDPSRSKHSTQMAAVPREVPNRREHSISPRRGRKPAPIECFWKRPTELKDNKFEGMEGKILGIPDYDIKPNPDTAILGKILEVRGKLVKVQGFDTDDSSCEYYFVYDACLTHHWKSHHKVKPLWKVPLRRKSGRSFRQLLQDILQTTAENESANVVPSKCFEGQMTWQNCPRKNKFMVDHCLETYSRKSGRFSTAVVVAVTKETVTLHLDGAPKEHRVELSFDDVRLFPCGFAQSIGEECKAPENIEDEWPVDQEKEEEEEEDESMGADDQSGPAIYEVERCYDRRWNADEQEYEYWTKWLNYPHTENTWEKRSNLALTCEKFYEDVDRMLDIPSSYKYKWYTVWREAVDRGELPAPALKYGSPAGKTGRRPSRRMKRVKIESFSGDEADYDNSQNHGTLQMNHSPVHSDVEMSPEEKAQTALEIGILPPHDPSKPFFDWVQHCRSKLYGGRIAPEKAFWKRQLGLFDNQFVDCEGQLLRAPDYNAPYDELNTLSVVCNVASVWGPWVEVAIFGNDDASYCRWYLAKDPCLHPFKSLSDDCIPKLKKSSNQGMRNDRKWRDSVEEELKNGRQLDENLFAQQISWNNGPSENLFMVGDKLEVYDEIMGDGNFNPATVTHVSRRGNITINFDGSSKYKDVHYKDIRLFPAGFAAAIGWTCQLYENDNPYRRKSKGVVKVAVRKSVSTSVEPSPPIKKKKESSPRKTQKREEAREVFSSPLTSIRRSRAALPPGMNPRQMDDDGEESGMVEKERQKRKEDPPVEPPDDVSAKVDLSQQCSSRGLLENNDQSHVDMSEDGIEENVADEVQMGDEQMLPVEQPGTDAGAVDEEMKQEDAEGPEHNYTRNDVRLLVNHNCTMGKYIDMAKFRAAFIDPEDYTLSTAWELIFKKLVKHTTDLPKLLEALPECAREDSNNSIRVNAGGQSYFILVPPTIAEACTCLKQVLNKLHACINAISLTGEECSSCLQERRVEL